MERVECYGTCLGLLMADTCVDCYFAYCYGHDILANSFSVNASTAGGAQNNTFLCCKAFNTNDSGIALDNVTGATGDYNTKVIGCETDTSGSCGLEIYGSNSPQVIGCSFRNTFGPGYRGG